MLGGEAAELIEGYGTEEGVAGRGVHYWDVDRGLFLFDRVYDGGGDVRLKEREVAAVKVFAVPL